MHLLDDSTLLLVALALVGAGALLWPRLRALGLRQVLGGAALALAALGLLARVRKRQPAPMPPETSEADRVAREIAEREARRLAEEQADREQAEAAKAQARDDEARRRSEGPTDAVLDEVEREIAEREAWMRGRR